MKTELEKYLDSHRYYITRMWDTENIATDINWAIGRFHCPHCDKDIDNKDVNKRCHGKKVYKG